MTLHNLDKIMVKDLTLPFEFQAESAEGIVDVGVYQNSEKGIVDHELKPYLWACAKLNLWGDEEGEYTIGQIKQDIKNFKPKNHNG